jgi:hypothetical protein
MLILPINNVNALDVVQLSYQKNVIVEPNTENTISINIRSSSYHTLTIYFEIRSDIGASIDRRSFTLHPLKNETVDILFHSPRDIGIYNIEWILKAKDTEKELTQTENGVVKVRVSNILKEIKNMKRAYIEQIQKLRRDSENFTENDREYINYFLDDIEHSVKDLDTLYVQGEYEKISTKMRSIETELLLIKEKIAKLRATHHQEFHVDFYILLGFVLPAALGSVLLIFIVKTFFFTGKIKLERIEDLKTINESIVHTHECIKVPLHVRIKRAEEKVRVIDDKRLMTELELIKEKYRQGFKGLCEDYLADLERELKRYG